MDGFFVVNKPAGPSSARVVGRIKWLLKQLGFKNIKVGHGGTLDPLAAGILPIGIGKGTKGLQALLEGPKQYQFTVEFGKQTSTDDAEGEVVATSEVKPTQAQVKAVLNQFIGEISQLPPIFSALKVDGQRAYALARAGQAVELQPRMVHIEALELLEMAENKAIFTAKVGKGTYIRALARDIALALGTVGYMAALTRTGHGPFTLEQAIAFETLDKALQNSDWKAYLLPLDACLGDAMTTQVNQEG